MKYGHMITCVALSWLSVWGMTGCHSGPEKSSGQQADSARVTSATGYHYLQGTTGDSKGILQLVQDKDQYHGTYVDDRNGRPLTVMGSKDSTGQWMLVSYVQYNPVDTFQGTFPQPDIFQGIHRDTSGGRDSFRFQEVYPAGTPHWALHTLTDSLALDTAGKGSPKARMEMALLWPAEGFSPIEKTLITTVIIKDYFGLSPDLSDPDKLLQQARDTFFNHYSDATKAWKGKAPGASFNWFSNGQMNLLWNADSLVSLSFQRYEFTGGAHGLKSTFLTVFDLKRDKILALDDIFKPGYEKVLIPVLERELRQQYELNDREPLNGPEGILFDKTLTLSKNFYLTGKGIGFLYNPYEVAPYVVGEIELFVPFTAIKDLLKQPF